MVIKSRQKIEIVYTEDTMQDFSIKCKMNRIFQIIEIMVMKYFIITIKEKRNENVKSRAAGFIVI